MADFAIKVQVSLLPCLINECHQSYCALPKQLVIIGRSKVFIKTSGAVPLIFIWVGRVFLLDFEKESVSGPAIKQKAAGISLSKRCMTMQTLRKVPKNAAQ